MTNQSQTLIPRDFKGIWTPKEVWLDRRLNYFEKMLLSEIHSLNGEKGCYASNEYLCQFFNERERKIQDGLAKLKSLGYVFIESFDGRTRIMRTNLNPQPVKSLFSTPDLSKNDTSDLTISCNAFPEENHPHTLYKRKGDNKDDLIEPQSGNLTILDFEGREQALTKQDLFSLAVTQNTDWTAQEIELLHERLAKHKGNVRDLICFCKAIIKKERIVNNINKHKGQKPCRQSTANIQKNSLEKSEKKTQESSEKKESQTTNSEILDKDIGMRLFANWRETL